MSQEINNDEKKCPFCAEIIKKEAIICRFCNSELDVNNTTKMSLSEKNSIGCGCISGGLATIPLFIMFSHDPTFKNSGEVTIFLVFLFALAGGGYLIGSAIGRILVSLKILDK